MNVLVVASSQFNKAIFTIVIQGYIKIKGKCQYVKIV